MCPISDKNDLKPLTEAEERFKAISEAAPLMIDSFDETGRCTYWNPECERVLGYTIEELNSSGDPMGLFYPDPSERQKVIDSIQNPDGKFREYQVRVRDGSIRRQMWANLPLSNQGLIAIGYDITAQKLAEEEVRLLNESLEQRVRERTQELAAEIAERKATQQILVQSSKMAALGEMAGGIAHEINNPLSVIQARVHLLKRRVELGKIDGSALIDDCKKIEETVFRISKIIHGLRTFARDAEDEPFFEEELTAIVYGTLELCSARLQNRGIQVITALPEESVRIKCRAIQIQQVLLNLLNNAHDAIREQNNGWIRIDAGVDNGFLQISVTDSGSGIPYEIQHRIMEPFFSTKEIGQGTGLGLSISRSIAETHGGSLTLDTSCQNTCFVLRIPVDAEKAMPGLRRKSHSPDRHQSDTLSNK